MQSERRLEKALDEHRAALQRFVSLVTELGDERWSRPWAEGKWTVAEVTEHLVLFYEAALRDLEGGAGVRLMVGGPMSHLLRWFILPHILFHRSLPRRVRAPREVRPTGRGLSRQAMLEALSEGARRFEEAVPPAQRDPRRTLSHPYFGRIRPLHFLRIASLHLDHHRRQLESLLG